MNHRHRQIRMTRGDAIVITLLSITTIGAWIDWPHKAIANLDPSSVADRVSSVLALVGNAGLRRPPP
jgi:hypothetical protein